MPKADRVTSSAEAASELHRCTLHRDGTSTSYRARINYGNLQAIANDSLGMPAVRAAALCVASWSEQNSRMPPNFWRDVTVRMSRDGAIHIKLVLQAPTHLLEGIEDTPFATLDAWPAWRDERLLFIAYAQKHVPNLMGMSYQLATGSARPPKVAPCMPLHGPLHISESHLGFSYDVGPETFSQVNHTAAERLIAAVTGWLGLGPSGPHTDGARASELAAAACVHDEGGEPERARGTAAATAAARAAVSSAESVLVSGRDVNLFGAALFATTRHHMHVVTHCACAYADLQRNLDPWLSNGGAEESGRATEVDGDCSSDECERRASAHLIAKGARTAAHLQGVFAGGAGSIPPPLVCVATAGRRGIGRDVCRALRASLLRVLVYVYCCEDTMHADVEELTGGAHGWSVADVVRIDAFPDSGLVGGALLLLRRPRALILPVGPSGSGKSTLCRRVAAALPVGAVTLVERDAIVGGHLADGCGVAAAKRRTYAQSCEAIHASSRMGRTCIFDSCNATMGGRAHYEDLYDPDVVIVLSMEGRGDESRGDEGRGGGNEDDHEAHRSMLLARTRARIAHPTFPPACEPARQAAAVDATLSAMEWPTPDEMRVAVPAGDSRRGIRRRVFIWCDPWATAEVRDGPLLECIFRAIVWPAADEEADWSHALRPRDLPREEAADQAGLEAVALTIRRAEGVGDDEAVHLSILPVA